MFLKRFLFVVLFCTVSIGLSAQKGYDLWLQYEEIEEEAIKKSYLDQLQGLMVYGDSEGMRATTEELETAYEGLLGKQLRERTALENNTLVLGSLKNLPPELGSLVKEALATINDEGYLLRVLDLDGKRITLITGNTEVGVLYGGFELIKNIQLANNISSLNTMDAPKIQKRVLNHWDNLDRTVERGYAGFSIWDWHHLPTLIKPEYRDYARANASIGINGTVLTNVNANALILTPQYLEKVKALADVFRPYGIQVYLTARFSAPIEIGDLETADPHDREVRAWWKKKATEIYEAIPDFGGFLVKANSEGQPGPNNYDRSHVDGANMLAEAVAPHNGIVMWRAFVYSEHDPEDRARQAFSEFVPFDGQFHDNVLVQVKNGPIDFQPREPFHPMFGAMPNTSLMMEFQITQEYLGFSSHLVYLPEQFEEILDEDTYVAGQGSTVARVIDGSLSNTELTGIAGVANIGTEKNWTGHPFGQANWYGFGRLAWDPYLDAEEIAREWLGRTFSTDEEFIKTLSEMMIRSRESVVKYMTPLGLHHIMDTDHHYGPGPWVDDLDRPEWNPVYYHRADTEGIGFDRTESGSNALSQYAQPIQEQYGAVETTPDHYLLWFHRVNWDYQMNNGESLWYNLAATYQEGVDEVQDMVKTWDTMKAYVDEERFEKTQMLLQIQLEEAKWWRDACLLYFQQFSGMDFPEFIPEPNHDLEYYKSLEFPYAPGIRPSWH